MPYIKSGRRDLSPWSPQVARNEGELNFQITGLLVEYIVENGLSYERIGDVEGALQNASKEFARRVTAPYEDIKIAENGDVYGPIFDAFSGVSPAKRRDPEPGAPDAGTSPEASPFDGDARCGHGRPECVCRDSGQER